MTVGLKSWSLFWVLALLTTAANCLELSWTDLRSERGAESIVLHSVVRALPLLVLAFTASSLLRLWPGRGTRWLMSNRRYIGVALRRLHKAGIYTLWFLPTCFYFEDFLKDHDLFSLAMLGVLLAALAVRGLAWSRQSGALRTAA